MPSEPEDSSPVLPKWPFIIVNFLLFGAAYTLIAFSESPPDGLIAASVVAIGVVAALVMAAPFVIEYVTVLKHASNELKETVDAQNYHLKTALEDLNRNGAILEKLAQGIAGSTAALEEVDEKLTNKITTVDQLIQSSESEKREIEASFDEYRKAESKELQELLAQIHQTRGAVEGFLGKMDGVSSDERQRIDEFSSKLEEFSRSMGTRISGMEQTLTKLSDKESPVVVPPGNPAESTAKPAPVPDAPTEPEPKSESTESEPKPTESKPVEPEAKAEKPKPAAKPKKKRTAKKTAPPVAQGLFDAANTPENTTAKTTDSEDGKDSAKPEDADGKPASAPLEKPAVKPVVAKPSASPAKPSAKPGSSTKPAMAKPAVSKPAKPVQQDAAEVVEKASEPESNPASLEIVDSRPEASGDSETPDPDPMETRPPFRVTAGRPGAVTLIARLNIGLGNTPFVRGKGGNLNTNRGVPMKFVEIGIWEWTAENVDGPVSCQIFKNDIAESVGDPIVIPVGQRVEVTPIFPKN